MAFPLTNQCPTCNSSALVEGHVIASGSEGGSSVKFFPNGLKFWTIRRSVTLLSRENFRACTECGHVWNTLDAAGLRELIEAAGGSELKAKLAARRGR